MGLQKSKYSEKYLSFNEERGPLAYINQPAVWTGISMPTYFRLYQLTEGSDETMPSEGASLFTCDNPYLL